jgi:hypothetical protein
MESVSSTHTWDKQACIPRPDPVACRTSPFLCSLCTFILGEVVASPRHCHVWLAAQDVLSPLYGFSQLWQVFLLCPEDCIPVHEHAYLFSLLPFLGWS